MSVRVFAAHLGVAVRTVSKWESLGIHTRPRPDTQAILDTALARYDAATQLLFEALLLQAGSPAVSPAIPAAGPRSWDYESWAEDTERAVAALSRQQFAFAGNLLARWLNRFPTCDLDAKGLYLLARSTAALGDLRRDQGAVIRPLSARQSYTNARALYAHLDIPRRVAQADLCLAVTFEMSGNLELAARQYERLAVDDRLSGRDRARARLWVGTALSKHGNHDYATQAMTAAIRRFEDLAEPDDWAVAHQKLALAHRGAGDLTRALHYLEIARSTGSVDSPMQRVRLDTAHGHILLSDRATAGDGLAVLRRTAELATQYGMNHQLRSVESIRRDYERPTSRPHRQPGRT